MDLFRFLLLQSPFPVVQMVGLGDNPLPLQRNIGIPRLQVELVLLQGGIASPLLEATDKTMDLDLGPYRSPLWIGIPLILLLS
ncbi:hypothetical protein DRN46_07000 [Thermococci archaeon]|nr:MAG: hypothetical protein DRN46_07000 [Thermococci archaeon]